MADLVFTPLVAPVINGVPTISGTEQEGQILTATLAQVTGTHTATFQWERGGTPISGANSLTYTLQAADVGNTLTFVQTATNSEGSVSAESAATGSITSAATVETLSNPTGTPLSTTTGVATVDSTGSTGTIYWRRRQGNTVANDTLIKSDATGSIGSPVVGTNSTGTQTGLAEGTLYYVDWVHETTAGFSNVVTSSFLTQSQGTGITNHNIVASRTTATAPAGIQFDSTAKQSSAARVTAPILDIESKWNLDDSGATNYSATTGYHPNTVDRNTDRGPIVNYVYDRPGTYTAIEEARDGTNTSIASAPTVTVNDPDVVFAGGDTAYVDPTGTHADAQAGWSTHTTISSAIAALAGRNNMRLLLQAGQTYAGGEIDIRNDNFNGKIFVGRVGAGNNPHIDESAKAEGAALNGIVFRTSNDNVGEVIIDRVDYTGNYDPASTPPTTTAPTGSAVVYSGVHTAHKTCWGMTIVNCGNSHFDMMTYTENFWLGDVDATGFRGYSWLIGEGGRIGVVGCKLINPSGTRNGTDGKGAPYYADHGSCRLSRPAAPMGFHKSIINSMADWSGGNDGALNQGHGMRWNTGGQAQDQNGNNIGDRFNQIAVQNDLYTEGAWHGFYNGTGSSPGIPTVWAIADGCIIMGVNTPGTLIQQRSPGSVYRNCVAVIPGVDPVIPTGTQVMWRDDPGGNTYLNGTSRQAEAYSNTLADYRTDAQARSQGGNQDRPFRDVEFSNLTNTFAGNNILYSPNMTTDPAVPNGTNLELVSTGTPIYTGRTLLDGAVEVAFATPAVQNSWLEPLTSSNALGAAQGKTSLLTADYLWREDVVSGLIRTANSVGPFEPSIEGLPSVDPADYANVVQNQTFTSTVSVDSGDDDTLYIGCTFENISSHGIQLRNVDNVVIYDCTFNNVDGTAVRFRSTGSTTNCAVIECDFDNIGLNAISTTKRYDTGVDHTNFRAHGNTIGDTGSLGSDTAHGIYVQSSEAVVTNNTLNGTVDANGISVRSSGYIANNVINVTSSFPGTASGIKYFSDHETGPTKRLDIRNNTIDGNLFSGVEIKDANATPGTYIDEDWIVNDYFIIGNTYGVGVGTDEVIDAAISGESWATVTQG